MSVRIYYLRDNNNIRTRKDGTKTRGNPIACVVTDVDKNTGTIKYAVSTVHPRFHFDKGLAKRIATGRLTNPRSVTVLEGVPNRGHEITLKVMRHIAENTTAATLRKFAQEWVVDASVPKRPAVVREHIDRAMGALPPTPAHSNIRA